MSSHLAPYQPISAEQYDTLIKDFPDVNFDDFAVDEHEDNTVGTQTLACTSGSCEL